MAAWRAGDWACPACGNHNFASKAACNQCGNPKPAENGMAAAMGGGMAAAMAGKGGLNPPRATPVFAGKGGKFGKGGGYGKAAPTAIAPVYAAPYAAPAVAAPQGDMRPGDWNCPSCGNHNFASRVVCNKCQTPGGKGGAGGKGGKAGMMMQMMQAMMGGKGGGQHAQRPGDWTCFACGSNNFASREQCFKCQVSKSTYISKSGMQPGDWLCPQCDNHNFSSREACNKCGVPKGAAEVSMAKMKEGDWLCPACANHNFRDKIACNRCQMARPEAV